MTAWRGLLTDVNTHTHQSKYIQVNTLFSRMTPHILLQDCPVESLSAESLQLPHTNTNTHTRRLVYQELSWGGLNGEADPIEVVWFCNKSLTSGIVSHFFPVGYSGWRVPVDSGTDWGSGGTIDWLLVNIIKVKPKFCSGTVGINTINEGFGPWFGLVGFRGHMTNKKKWFVVYTKIYTNVSDKFTFNKTFKKVKPTCRESPKTKFPLKKCKLQESFFEVPLRSSFKLS